MSNIIWILTPKKENLDYSDLIVKISKKQDINLADYDIGQVNSVVYSFKDEIVEYLLEHGFSSLISSGLILEQIVAKGTPVNKIIPLIQSYLDRVNIDKELIIVDPYFFAKQRTPGYVNFIDQVLDKYIPTIEDLIIVTNSYAIDATVKSAIISTLKGKKPSLNIIHKQNDDFHDRFWISGAREKGLVMGTSMNGLGNKIALIDRLNTSDVRDIITELKNNGLL
ncbi:MAG: hypothetical protein WCL06_04165 [Bacteroidota bacterium]